MKKVAIGLQSFEKVRKRNVFYVDKTRFIREWWERGDDVTLIARPRRFGKTLNMSTLETFFSTRYNGRGDLFEGLEIWKDEEYRAMQGTWPVIFLSFASVKETTYEGARRKFNQILTEMYTKNSFMTHQCWKCPLALLGGRSLRLLKKVLRTLSRSCRKPM